MTPSLQFLCQYCSKFASSCLYFTYTNVVTNFLTLLKLVLLLRCEIQGVRIVTVHLHIY